MTAPDLIRLADSLLSAQNPDSASVIATISVRKARQQFGETDTVYTSALFVLGRCKRYGRDYAEAARLFNLALEISESIVGPDHLFLCPILRWLGGAYIAIQEREKAESLLRRRLEILRTRCGPYDPCIIRATTGVADVCRPLGKYNEVEALNRQALQIADSIYGPAHPIFSSLYSRLGFVSMILGKYRKSEEYFLAAVEICESLGSGKKLAEEQTLNELGRLYELLGRYDEAELYLSRARRLFKQFYANENTILAIIMANLGNLYRSQGRYDDAERAYKESYAIRSGTDDSDPHLAESLGYLGELYTMQHRYKKAEACFKRAIEYREQYYGHDHSYLYYSLRGLGELYVAQKRFEEADSVLLRCLRICEQSLGQNHLHTALTLKSLGDSYMGRGRYIEAESTYLRTLRLEENVLGSDNSAIAETLNNLALNQASSGNFAKALASYDRLLESRHAFIENVFSYTSENQKLRFLEIYPLINNSLFSFALMDTSYDSKALALEMLIKGKGVVMEALAAQKELLSWCPYDDKMRMTADKLYEICKEISDLTIAARNAVIQDMDRLENLHRVKDSLEAEISRKCSYVEREMEARRFDLSSVANAIPAGAVLWEFVAYEPYDFKKIGIDSEKKSALRYLAFTLDSQNNVTVIDLGKADMIDSLICLSRILIDHSKAHVYPYLMAKSEKRLGEVTSKLHELIFAPLEPSLADRTDIFISPDGQLCLLPFEILLCPDSSYVIEKYSISYLSSGRDLLKFYDHTDPSHRAIVMADPDFSFSAEGTKKNRSILLDDHKNPSHSTQPSRSVIECLTGKFSPLRYSRKEADAVAAMLSEKGNLEVRTYYGEDALEEVLKAIPVAPRVLHLAVHGYFCKDIDYREDKMFENPLLRSGLALAGADWEPDSDLSQIDPHEDGILTGFEVSGLNLCGTELVVLSACETGVGEVKIGEGVFGFRRAFQHAGVRSLLMSMWKVTDKETYELMNDFYETWLDDFPKREALRNSILQLMGRLRARYGVAHPYYWGAFVLLGDPN